MTLRDWIGYAVVLVVLAAVAGPLGRLIVRVVEGARDGEAGTSPGRIGRLWLRAAGAESSGEQTAARYLGSFLAFHLTGIVALYALQRAQPWLGQNPEGLAAPSPDLAWNAAVSFVTNTNWQSYGGESTFGYAVQAGGFVVQNFLSAGSGLAVMFAVARSLVRERSTTIGNFWRDLARSVVFVLLPLSVVLALVSAANGVPQTSMRITAFRRSSCKAAERRRRRSPSDRWPPRSRSSSSARTAADSSTRTRPTRSRTRRLSRTFCTSWRSC